MNGYPLRDRHREYQSNRDGEEVGGSVGLKPHGSPSERGRTKEYYIGRLKCFACSEGDEVVHQMQHVHVVIALFWSDCGSAVLLGAVSSDAVHVPQNTHVVTC